MSRIAKDPIIVPQGVEVNIVDIQELWQVNSKLTFGIDEPSGSNLLKELQQSMEDLLVNLKNTPKAIL